MWVDQVKSEFIIVKALIDGGKIVVHAIRNVQQTANEWAQRRLCCIFLIKRNGFREFGVLDAM
jgi:hypothetical protein